MATLSTTEAMNWWMFAVYKENCEPLYNDHASDRASDRAIDYTIFTAQVTS